MDIDYTTVADEAGKLIEKTLSNLAAKYGETKQADGAGARLLFPNGIELIYVKFRVGNDVELTLAVSGEKAKYPSGLIAQNEPAIVLDE